MVSLYLLLAAPTVAQSGGTEQQKPTWLWVKDRHTRLGVAGASVEIGPRGACVGPVKFAKDMQWIARYVTGPAGRVLTEGLPGRFSCRVTLEGRELRVVSASQTTLNVDIENVIDEGVELDYWRTTNTPTQFRAYIQDLEHFQE